MRFTALLKLSASTSSFLKLPSSVIFILKSTVPGDITKKFYIFAVMVTLLFILFCIAGLVLIVALVPYIIGILLGIGKAIWIIVTGRDKDPEFVEERKAFEAKRAAKKEARKKRRKNFWRVSPSFMEYFH